MTEAKPKNHHPSLCLCQFARCRRDCNKNAQRMSVFKGEHLLRVLTKPLPDDPELRARVIAKPKNFKVHTSHFAADDLEKRKGHMSPKPGAMPVPISQAERWVQAGRDGRIRSSQASLSTGSRPPPAPPAAPRSGAPLADVSNRLLSNPAVGSAKPAASIPLFASPASQQPEKRVRLGLTGGRSHGVNQVRAALVLEEQLRVLKRDHQTSRGRIQGLEKECTWGE